MKRILLILLLLILIPASIAQATVTYTSSLVVSNNSSTAYTQLGVTASQNVTMLVANGYITSTGLDARVQQNGADLPYMMASDRVTFSVIVPANSSNTYQFVTGQAPASSFQIVTGYNGYVTIADSANLEHGANFTDIFSGYVDTSRLNSVIIKKTGAYEIVTGNASGNITANILTNFYGFTEVDTAGVLTVTGDNITATSASSTIDAYVYKDYGVGYFNALSIDFILQVSAEATNPSGYGGIAITNTVNDISGFAATDIFVGGVTRAASLVALYLTRGNGVAQDTSIDLAPGTWYVTVSRAASGDNVTATFYSDSARTVVVDTLIVSGFGATTYRYGFGWVNNNSGLLRVISGSVKDLSGSVSVVKSVSVAGIASGEMVISPKSDGANFWMTVGSQSSANVTTLSVPNTSNSYIIGSLATPYINYVKMSVNGTEGLWYEPTAIISGTTLPDRSLDATSNNGTITWGTNPANVLATFGGLSSTQVITTNATSTGYVGDFLPTVSANSSPTLVQAENAVQSDLLYAFIKPFADTSGTGAVWFYWFGTIVVAILFFVLAYRTKHLLIAAIAFDVPFAFGIAKGYIPPWVIIVLVLWTIGAVIQESKM